MSIATIFDTASVWKDPLTPGLHLFIVNEKIINGEHQQKLQNEIVALINSAGMDTPILKEEKQELKYLLRFIMSAPVGVPLYASQLDNSGKYLYTANVRY